MSALILLDAPPCGSGPGDFPCWRLAVRYLQAARSCGHAEIRVERCGHAYSVERIQAELARQTLAGRTVLPTALIESQRALERYAGAPFEVRMPIWSGALGAPRR